MEIVANQFTFTGRGGLPPSQNNTLQRESMQTNGATTRPLVENCDRHDFCANPNRSVPCDSNLLKTPALVEAQRWVYGQNGDSDSHCPIYYSYPLQSLTDTRCFLQC